MSVLKRLVGPFGTKRSANDDFRAWKSTVRKAKQRKLENNSEVAALKPYRATSVVPCDGACTAAKGIEGKRFLVAAGEVPMLPLPDCNAAKCHCRYAHHDDRRDVEAGDRRQWSSSFSTEAFASQGENDKRRSKKRGRRKTD